MIASYRLQLHPDFTFADAEALVPYFRRLGISHLYLSPITQARPGSTHGYDVINHNAIRDDLGGAEGFDRLLEACRSAGLDLVLDYVPNHAGVGPNNQFWQETLAYGPQAPHAHYFDIDWTPLKPELQGKILLPFLGTSYGDALDGGHLGLAYHDGHFVATYYDNHFTLSPSTYAHVLSALLPGLERTETYFDVKDLAAAYEALAPEGPLKADVLRPRLAALADDLDLDEHLAELAPATLHEILEQQHWRLAYWKTAGSEINYRRFFDINGLVALRMEDAQVFWDTHRLLGDLLARDGVAGVRIDHVDGLFDPHAYLHALSDLGARRIWVEKILAPGETLPDAWPVEGTTGYEFMNDVLHLLVQPRGEASLNRTYRRFMQRDRTFERIVHRSKRLVMDTSLSSELFRLSYELDRLSESDYHTRDFTLDALSEALAEVIAAFPRYRTYLPYDAEEAHEVILHAVYKARQRNPATEPTVYDFLIHALLGTVRDDLRARQYAWIGRFQQYTAPVTAKGIEDTAFYRYVRLTAFNEVGGEPDEFSLSAQAFHSRARFRAHRYPRNLLATATHDHKRGEDTRTRLLALAEVPDAWDETVAALMTIGDDYRGSNSPSRTDEYLFYQTLAALWHDAERDTLADRLWTYAQKAARESKLTTSWINPDESYEQDLEVFVRGVTTDERTPGALDDLAATLARLGFFNTLSQTILKLTTPGVPDFYQGTELFDLSLVDPDNRRPVDYEHRQALLDEMADLTRVPNVEAVRPWFEAREAKAKFFATARLLRLRRERPSLFTGSYRPLTLDVDDADEAHWVAYAREIDGAALLVHVPRFSATLPDEAPPLALPDDLRAYAWTDVLTGAPLDPADALDLSALPLPWAILLGTSS